MKNYLANYEALSKIIDTLLNQKYPNGPIEKHDTLREKSINELDDQIGNAIFSRLSKSELNKLNQMLDQDSTSEEDFQKFFESADLDLPKITKQTIEDYSEKFLQGDKNA